MVRTKRVKSEAFKTKHLNKTIILEKKHTNKTIQSGITSTNEEES